MGDAMGLNLHPKIGESGVGGGGLLCCLYRNAGFFLLLSSFYLQNKRAGAMMCAGSTPDDGRIPTLLYRHRRVRAHLGMALVRQPRSALPGGCWCRRHLSGTRQERKVDSLGGGGGSRLRRAKVGRGTGNGLGKGTQAQQKSDKHG